MKTTRFFLALVLIFSLLAISCKKKKTDPPANNVPVYTFSGKINGTQTTYTSGTNGMEGDPLSVWGTWFSGRRYSYGFNLSNYSGIQITVEKDGLIIPTDVDATEQQFISFVSTPSGILQYSTDTTSGMKVSCEISNGVFYSTSYARPDNANKTFTISNVQQTTFNGNTAYTFNGQFSCVLRDLFNQNVMTLENCTINGIIAFNP